MAEARLSISTSGLWWTLEADQAT